MMNPVFWEKDSFEKAISDIIKIIVSFFIILDMQYMDIRSVGSRLKTQFRIELAYDELVSYCVDALVKLRALPVETKYFVGNVKNYQLLLPPGVWKIMSITHLSRSSRGMTPVFIGEPHKPLQELFTAEGEEETQTAVPMNEGCAVEISTKPAQGDDYVTDFVWKCPYLRFKKTDFPVVVEAKTILLNKEGVPLIPKGAFFACLYYCLYVYYQPQFILKQIDFTTMRQIEEWKNENFRQSVQNLYMDSLTRNDLDEIMNIASSFDRKQYNIPV